MKLTKAPSTPSDVREVLAASSEFSPTVYTGDITVGTTVASTAIGTGVCKVYIINKHATNTLSVAFGPSQATAETNAATGTGLHLPASTSIILGVPEGSTHVAYVASAITTGINLIQGGA